MRYVTWRRWALAVALAVLLAALPPAPRAFAAGQMVSLETPHYKVQTDISPAFAQLVGRHMEAIFQQYSSQFRDYGQVTTKFNVIVYGREADYKLSIPQGYWGSAGIFISDSQVLAAHAEKRTTEDVLRTLYHEGFHQFMFEAVAGDCPVWVNEGLAEYFSNSTWNGLTFSLGQIPATPLYVIQQRIKNGTYLHFDRLFRMTTEDWRSASISDKRQASLLYSEAWSVVHFLIHADGGRHSPMLDRYLKEVSQGQVAESALQDAFGKDYAQFERSWASYVMSLTPSPKFACRDNMECLLLLVKFQYPGPPGVHQRGATAPGHPLPGRVRLADLEADGRAAQLGPGGPGDGALPLPAVPGPGGDQLRPDPEREHGDADAGLPAPPGRGRAGLLCAGRARGLLHHGGGAGLGHAGAGDAAGDKDGVPLTRTSDR